MPNALKNKRYVGIILFKDFSNQFWYKNVVEILYFMIILSIGIALIRITYDINNIFIIITFL